MSRPGPRRLLTPLRASFALHALLLGLLIYLVPTRMPEPAAEPMTIRFVEDDAATLAEPSATPVEASVDPVDTLEVLDFDVLLPPLEIEDVLPAPDEATKAREPLASVEVPPDAARKRRPAPAVAPVPAPRAAPRPRARPAKGGVPRVIRRPGRLRGFYPRDAQRQGIEGKALVLVRVDERGQVVSARVHTSTGHASLDAAALRVARLYEFAPGLPGRVLLPVPFRLRD